MISGDMYSYIHSLVTYMYIFYLLNLKKKDIEKKTGKKIKLVAISAKNKNKKRRFPISKKIFHNIDFERCIFQIGRKMHFACLRVHNFENKVSEAFEAREILLEFEVRSAEWC